MTWKPDEKLQALIRADIDSHYQTRKRELELEHQEALKEFERWVSGKTASVPAPRETSTVSRDNRATANGSSGPLTTRQMMLRVMPELHQGGTFTSSDIKERILGRWPGITNKQLSTRISQILTEMCEEGTLDRRKMGPRIQDPYLYEVRKLREETLLPP
jgi:hypothetical protein